MLVEWLVLEGFQYELPKTNLPYSYLIYMQLQKFQRLSFFILCWSKVLTAGSVPSKIKSVCLKPVLGVPNLCNVCHYWVTQKNIGLESH